MNKTVHCKKSKFDQYVGRPTLWGNPFVIGKDGNRNEVIAKYKEYFLNRINNDENFKKETLKLKGKILSCWCFPQTCHGDIIIEWLNEN